MDNEIIKTIERLNTLIEEGILLKKESKDITVKNRCDIYVTLLELRRQSFLDLLGKPN